ncbi:hypothetical protein [Bacillus toyonensis]|uniref:hypothetical protein n=1 Tax=Bacillus toyonensis TaxID=155322 RepID=UPI000BED781B|nr:hypothetical protein [Bacillus toyonensis]PED17202.1 hypothetical protein CON63_27375 [Bacillus toyonensis]
MNRIDNLNSNLLPKIHWPDWPPKLPGGLHFQWPPGELPDLVKIVKKKIENGAKTVTNDEVTTVLQSFTEQASKLGEEIISKEGQRYIDEINELRKEYEQLSNQLNISKIKRDILTKAEQFCEAYIKEKVSLPKDFPMKIFPKVHLDCDLNQISIELDLYVLRQEDDEETYEETYLISATFLLKQKFNESIQTPDFVVEPNPNLAQNELDIIKKQIEDQKEIIVTQLIESIISDYVPPLRLLKDYLPIF